MLKLKRMKSFEQLLKDYKKSNKVRRANILTKAGYGNESIYLIYLAEKIKWANKVEKIVNGKKQKWEKIGESKQRLDKKKVDEIPTIHNVHILDVSGSMSTGGKIGKAIKGINTEIKELQKDKTVIYTQTIVDFASSGDIKIKNFLTPINDVVTYHAITRGMTALYEAVGETLTRLRDSVPETDKVLVKIFTDGGENDSRGKWSTPIDLSHFIDVLEKRGFTITFVGTEVDVKSIIRDLKIHASNTLSHNNTAAGVSASFNMSLGSTISYAKSVVAKEDVSRGFYKKIKQ